MGVKTSKNANTKINENKKSYSICWCGSRTLPSEREEDLDYLDNINFNNNNAIIFNYNYEDFSFRLKEDNVINLNIIPNTLNNIKTTPIENNTHCNFTQTSPKNESNDDKSNKFNSIQSNMIKNEDNYLINQNKENNDSFFKNKINDINDHTIEDEGSEFRLKKNLNNINQEDEKKCNEIIKEEKNENYNDEETNEFKIISIDKIKKENSELGILKSSKDENNNNYFISENLNIEIDNEKISSIVSNMFEMFPNLKQVNNPIAIIYKSNLIKLINIPERKNLKRTVERFCLATKDNFFLFHSYESYLRVQSPLGILPINSIKSCVQFKVKENNLKYDHFYIQYELNDDTMDFYNKINNFYLNDSENSKNEPILLFTSNDSNIIKNWYILLNFFISLEK